MRHCIIVYMYMQIIMSIDQNLEESPSNNNFFENWLYLCWYIVLEHYIWHDMKAYLFVFTVIPLRDIV